MNITPWLQVIEKPLSNPPGILPCLLASIMLEEDVMQAAWGGNPDTYTNTLCSPQLRNTAGTGKVKTGGFKGGGAERMLSSGGSTGIALMSRARGCCGYLHEIKPDKILSQVG